MLYKNLYLLYNKRGFLKEYCVCISSNNLSHSYTKLWLLEKLHFSGVISPLLSFDYIAKEL